MTTLVIDPVRDPRWADLVRRAEGSVFHHPAWIGLLREQYGFPMRACCVADAGGTLVAGLPIATVGGRLSGRRLVALPFSDICPPLLCADAGAELLHALEGVRAGVPLEVHGPLSGAAPGPRFHRHVVSLEPGAAAVERRCKPANRRAVRRALREGLAVERRTDADALAAFYRLHVATRARLGVPTQPRRFLMRFADLFAAGLGFVMLVRRRERPIAAAVFFTHSGVLTYKYGASDARYLALRPNNLLFVETIRWACERGMRELDLGRTDWHHDSLRAFKLSWGAQESELRYRRLGEAAPVAGRERLERGLAAALRRSPPVASRIVGEVLYRHAA